MSNTSPQLETARRLHEAGELAQAEAIYSRLMADSPDDAELCHLLGALERQTGRVAAAIAHLQRAISLRGDDPTMHFNLAGALEDAAQTEQAAKAYHEALCLAPDFVEARLHLGTLLRRSGRLAEAEACYRTALEKNANLVPALLGLGIVRQKLADSRGAADLYRRVLALEPSNRQARFNLATTLHQLGDSAAAVELFQVYLGDNPRDVPARQNLAHMLAEQGESVAAERHYRRVLELMPHDAAAHLHLGTLYYRQRRYTESAEACRRAVELRPDWAAAYVQLGLAEGRLRGPEAGAKHLEQAARLEPQNLLRQVAALSAGKTVFRNIAEIDEYRARLARRLSELQDSPAQLHGADIPGSFCKPPFCLPYHGRDDRPLKEQFAAIFARVIKPTSRRRAERGGLPHVGLVVTAGHEGVFLRGMAGIVRRKESGRLKMTIICHASGRNRLQRVLGTESLEYLILPGDFEQAVRRLYEARLDVLHYWEIGTDSVNYFLPFYRCAPVQMTSWGWPTTSGIPAVDYFLSSQLLEDEWSDRYYSERLIRLPTLPTCYERPHVCSEIPARVDFGLPERTPVYLCPQNLSKFHPDFDQLVGKILRADPCGQFAAIAARDASVTDAVRRRMISHLPDVAARIRFLPRVAAERFPLLLRCADVLLDTPHYGGGANTTLDVLGQALPLVSLRGDFQRGRWAAACYARMRLPEGIIASCEDYVSTAVQLANDPTMWRAWSSKIAESNHLLFDDEMAARETIEFWIRAAAEGRDRLA